MGVKTLRGSHLALAVVLLFANHCGASKQAVVERDFVVAASFNPVKECHTTGYGRFARGANCPNAELIFVSREPSPEVLLRTTRADLERLGQTVESRVLRVNGRDLSALAVSYGSPDRPVVSSLVTALAVPDSRESIEVQCFARSRPIDPKRCVTLLDAFIEQGLLRGEWPSVLGQSSSRRAIEFDVAGHTVLLPGSCDELGVFEVQCKAGHVTTHLLARPDQMQPALTSALAKDADPTLALERQIPCTVEGIATRCVVRRSRLPFGDSMHRYYAAIEIRGTPMLIACETRATQSRILPGEVCSRFFTFEDGALEEPQEGL